MRTSHGTVDLGAPFVIQGYANGWLVPESGELILEWTPQRLVLGSLVLSLLCAAGLVVLALRRPRDGTPLNPKEHTLPGWLPSRLAVIATLGLVIAFAGILPAIVAGLFLFLPRRLSLYAIGALVAAIASIIIVQQTRYNYPATLDWPLRFADLTPLTWIAVALACINPLLRRN